MPHRRARIGMRGRVLHVAQRHARVKAVLNACRSAQVAESEAPSAAAGSLGDDPCRAGRYLM